MSDDALIRLENLQEIVRRRGLGPAKLSRLCGGSPNVSYFSDLLLGHKHFGEKIARKLEAALGLPRTTLDSPLDGDPLPGDPPPAATLDEPLQLSALERAVVLSLRAQLASAGVEDPSWCPEAILIARDIQALTPVLRRAAYQEAAAAIVHLTESLRPPKAAPLAARAPKPAPAAHGPAAKRPTYKRARNP